MQPSAGGGESGEAQSLAISRVKATPSERSPLVVGEVARPGGDERESSLTQGDKLGRVRVQL